VALLHRLGQRVRRWMGGFGLHGGKYRNLISSLQDIIQVA
jgi:hypothetical protein